MLGVEVDLVGLTAEAGFDSLLLDLGGRVAADDVGNGRPRLGPLSLSTGERAGQVLGAPSQETGHRAGAEGDESAKRPVNEPFPVAGGWQVGPDTPTGTG